jgi:hypothetical protein
MKFYAIREKGTDKFLPYRFHRKRGGASVDEPVEITEGMMPRPFLTLASARVALSNWLQGVWRTHSSGPSMDGEYDSYTEPTTVEHRKKENMEIVVIRYRVSNR